MNQVVGFPGFDDISASATSFEGTTMQLTAVLTHDEEGGFIAFNPETGTTTQGESIEAALENLREATSLYLEEFPLSNARPPLVTSFSVPSHA